MSLINDLTFDDWNSFVEYLLLNIRAGRDETFISDEVVGASFRLSGKIQQINLDEEFSPGLGVCMNPGFSDIGNGKVLRTDYLFLEIKSDEKNRWCRFEEGRDIAFKAQLKKTLGPFNEIQLSEDDDDNEIILMIALSDAELL